MKRRIFSILLALCMVLSLLPATAFAASATVNATIGGLDMSAAAGEVKYATMNEAGAATTATESAWNIKLDNTGDVAVLSLKDINAQWETNADAMFNLSGDGALKIDVLNACTIKFKWKTVFKLAMAGGTTITSTDNSLLTITSSGVSNSHNTALSAINVTAGDLTLTNANVNAYSATASGASYADPTAAYAINAAGNMTVSGGTLVANGESATKGLHVTGNLTVTDGADVTAQGEAAGYGAHVEGNIAVANGAKLTAFTTSGYNPAVGRYAINKLPADMEGITAKYKSASATVLTVLPEDADIDALGVSYIEFSTGEVSKAAAVNANIGGVDMTAAPGDVKYATISAAGVVALSNEDTWNIKLDNTGEEAVLSLKDIDTKYEANVAAMFNLSGDGALKIDVLTACTILFKWKTAFKLAMVGGTTITSTDNSLLTITSSGVSNSHNTAQSVIDVTAGDLTLTNANVDVYSATASGATHADFNAAYTIKAAGNMTVNGGTLVAKGESATKALSVTGNLSVVNGANVTVQGELFNATHVDGIIAIDDATLVSVLEKGAAPSSSQYAINKMPDVLEAVTAKYSTSAAGTVLVDLPVDADLHTLGARYVEFRPSHICSYAGDCMQSVTCSCGKTLEARANHTFTEDSDSCTAPGCEYVRPAALRATIGGVAFTTPHGEVKYAIMDAAGAITVTDANGAWNIKVDNTGEEAVLSLKGINATYQGSTTFFDISSDGALKIEVLADSTIVHKWKEAFKLDIKGGTTITSVDESLLSVSVLNNNLQTATASIKVTKGTLTFENAYVQTSVVGDEGRAFVAGEIAVGINAADDVTFRGGNVRINNDGSHAITMKVGGDLTVENGANVTLYSDSYNYNTYIEGEFVVDNAKLIGVAIFGDPTEEHYVFNKLPTTLEGVIAKYSTEGHGPDLAAFPEDADLHALSARYIVFRVPTQCDINGTHTKVVGSEVNDPTCTEDGYTTYTCECGDIYTGDIVEAEGHFGGTATCTTQAKCRVCKEYYGELKPHEQAEDDGNCLTAVTCKKCTYVFVEAKAEHTPGTPVLDEETNEMVTSCTECGTEISRVSAECEHTGGEATCTEQAKCEVCGTAYGELAQHVQAEDDGNCLTAVTCKNCTYVFVEAKDAHTGGEATCTEQAKCEVCGTAYGDTAAHEQAEDDGDCLTAVTCKNCTYVFVAAKDAHTGGEATCTEQAKCEVCGTAYGELAQHVQDEDDGDCLTAVTCKNCTYVFVAAKDAHTGGEATCTEQAKCEVCGTAYGDTAAHEQAEDDGDCLTAVTCKNCDYVFVAAKDAHTGGEATCTAKAECEVCGTAYGELAQHVQDEDDGNCLTAVTCKNCTYVFVAAKTQHTAGTPVLDETTNEMVTSCTECGTEISRVSAECEHSGGTATCTALAVCEKCDEPYGNFAPHVQDEDDGNCTTAVTCKNCTHVFVAAKDAHTGGTASCTAKAACTVCGTAYGELAQHVQAEDDGNCLTAVTCKNCTYVFVAAKDAHTGGEATCTEQAKCEVCGTAYGDTAAHEQAEDDGDCLTAVTCKNCTYVFVEAKDAHTGGEATCTAKAECEVCGTAYGELAQHVQDEDDGNCLTAVTCKNCDYVFVAAKDAHTGGEATCTEQAKCEVCGTAYGDTAAHEQAEDDGDCLTAVTCKNCDYVFVAAKDAHTGGEATCTEQAKCEVCGTAYGDTAAHEQAEDDGDCLTAVTCKNCTYVFVAAKDAHTGGEATCTEQAKCEVCGTAYGDTAAHEQAEDDGDCLTAVTCKNCDYVFVAAKDAHTGGEATCTEQAKCEVCGTAYGELAQHVQDEDDGNCLTAVTCKNCTYVFVAAKDAHTGGEATCVALAECEVCGTAYGELGNHKFNQHVETVEPTVDAAGYEVYKCEHCEETETRAYGAQLTKPTLALNGTVLSVTDTDNIFVQMAITYLGADSGVNVDSLTGWADFTALNGKNLNGRKGYNIKAVTDDITLADNGDYVFYVTYKNGEENATFFQLVQVAAANNVPEITVSGNKAELIKNDNVIIQSGVKFVGKESGINIANITNWGAFSDLAGKTLNGKNGYTILTATDNIILPDNGDYIFYVIYRDVAGARKTVFFKETVNVEFDKPTISLNKETGVATLESNGFTVVQSGVKFVTSITDGAVANMMGWGDFTALEGQNLKGRNGYTNLGTESTSTLTMSGDYVYYVIYKDARNVNRTIFYKVTL